MKGLISKINFIFFLSIGQFIISANTTKDIDQNNDIENGDKNLLEGNYKDAISYYEIALRHYTSSNNTQQIGISQNKIGTVYHYMGHYTKALEMYKVCINTFTKINYQKGIVSATNNIGAIYYYLGNYPIALEYYKKALNYQKKSSDTKLTAGLLQNVGAIYYNIADYKNAMKYYQNAFSIYTQINDSRGIAQSLNSIGYVYIKIENFAAAENELNKAISIAQNGNDKQTEIEILLNLGSLYYIKENYNQSLLYYQKSLKMAENFNSLQPISNSKISLGNIFFKHKNVKKAIKFCKEGLSIAEKLGSIPLKKEACECLYKSYKKENKEILALSYYEKSLMFKDSLQSVETSNKMMDMEFQNKLLLDSISYVKKEHAVQLKHKEEVQKKEKQRNIIIISLCFILILSIALWSRLNFVRKSKKELQFEKNKSDKLLLNILPEEIAQELKEKGAVNARDFNLVTILFSDFKSFTQTAENMTPQELVEEINICFKAFDIISEKYQIEKIKTIGDSYMAAGGIPIPNGNFIINTVHAALEMQEFIRNRKLQNDILCKPAFEMRIGIHAGPIVAGIVGIKKFQYDVWGDTVNTASRIESNGTVGMVNISETLYQILKNVESFNFTYRGNIHAKGKGNINMYYIDKNIEAKKTTKPSVQVVQV